MLLPYNTELPKMVLPEYGRNVHNMISYCLTIPDREERTACACAIADIMGNMFPEMLGENKDYQRIWDHINIMSNFKLDIDFPLPTVTEEALRLKPEKLPYTSSSIRYRHYGKNIEKMIEIVADMEDGEEKENLISMIAHHMKKLMLIHNKEGVSDAKILKDLCNYSHGKINLDPATYILHEYQEAPQPKQNKNKKRKK